MIKGIPQTTAALAAIRLRLEAAAPSGSQAGGEIVRRNMATTAPIDTGNLVRLLETAVDEIGGGATTRVGSDAPYDRFVQLGTRYMAANPYGERAAAASPAGIVAAMIPIFKAAAEA